MLLSLPLYFTLRICILHVCSVSANSGYPRCPCARKLDIIIYIKTQSYKYLGVWFTKNGKFTKAKKHLADQAKKAMFSLQSTIARLHHPPIPIILQLYESMLKPIMCYGCEIWGFTENTDLEKIELRFLKAIYTSSSDISSQHGSSWGIRTTAHPHVVERTNTKILGQDLLRRSS